MGCGPSKAAEAVIEVPVRPTAQELAKAEKEKAKKERMGESAEPLPDFTPNPAFVIKTKRTNTFQKAFINVMHHELVPATARYVTRDEQWKLDKKGENCVVFTAVIPSSLYAKMAKDPKLPPMVISFSDLFDRMMVSSMFMASPCFFKRCRFARRSSPC